MIIALLNWHQLKSSVSEKSAYEHVDAVKYVVTIGLDILSNVSNASTVLATEQWIINLYRQNFFESRPRFSKPTSDMQSSWPYIGTV